MPTREILPAAGARGAVSLALAYARNPLTFRPGKAARGRCNVCGRAGFFLSRWTYRRNPRENLSCPRCASISRDRFLSLVLAETLGRPPVLAAWPETPEVRVLEPSARRGRADLLATKVDLRRVEFPAVSLEALPFEDASFDHVITADVFEHVRRDDVAFAEVRRVLRSGGVFFLQVPFMPDSPTETRVRVEGNRDVLLLPPEYHAGHTLVYRIYGGDLLPRLAEAGFEAHVVRGDHPRWGIPPQEMVVARKVDRAG